MLLAHLGAALACGGFACDNTAPVLQAAERIVFGVDPEDQDVEMHVQVTYTGPSRSFAWIVPVPATPELFVSTSDLFTQLALATQPTFRLRTTEDGHCLAEPLAGGPMMADAASSGVDESTDWDVTVAAEQVVGPYETVTLSAGSVEDLAGWLTEAGYDLPAGFADRARPYVSDGSSFVALRLAKHRDLGDLAPLGLRYHADRAVVPVQLTAISAAPDLRMEAYVLSRGRGVPTSYLHVTINDAAVNWWTGGANYDAVITRAADEAGGHAFATDYHGTSDVALFWPPGARLDRAALERETDPWRWLSRVRSDFPRAPTAELYEVLEDAFGLDGMGTALWFGYGATYAEPTGFDAETATADLFARVVEPLGAAQDLLDRYPRLTRMTSSLDAVEMTVDPVFQVNEDLARTPVASDRSAELVYHCRGVRPRRESVDRTLVLADGRHIDLPSERDLEELGLTEFQWLEEHREIHAQVIEQMHPSGPPDVVADFTDDLFALTQVGCGCTSAPSGAGWLLLAALPGWARRRR